MTRAKTFMIVSGLALALAAGPAAAEQVDLGKLDPDKIKSICAGGEYLRGGGVWSCFKKCTGGTCSVICDKDGCTGTTPAPSSQPVAGERAVHDVLNGKIAVRQQDDDKAFPWGLLGLLGLAGLLGMRGRAGRPVNVDARRDAGL